MSRHVLILSSLMLVAAASTPVVAPPVEPIPEVVNVDAMIPEALPATAPVDSVSPVSPEPTDQALVPTLLPEPEQPMTEWDCPGCGMG